MFPTYVVFEKIKIEVKSARITYVSGGDKKQK